MACEGRENDKDNGDIQRGMIMGNMIVLNDGSSFDEARLESEKWLSYLYYTENKGVNIERVDVVEQISGKETLSYVLRTLDILENNKSGLDDHETEIVRMVLSWSEVAKGGSVKERESWRKKGYPLDIHNLASAEIYLEECQDTAKNKTIISTLIRTHGLIGQALRGEVRVDKNAPLLDLKKYLTEESLERIVKVLNLCIIGGVSEALWEKVKDDAMSLIDRVLAGDFTEFPDRERMERLDPRLKDAEEELQLVFAEKIFPKYELWYYQAAFADFMLPHIKWLLCKAVGMLDEDVAYISFKPVADALYYDFQGKKHLNVYKERIIEKYIKEPALNNVALVVLKQGKAVLCAFRFSKVCEKLIDFCVEAERSGLLTFEKSITVLYDMFGFRRDEFDRLNNEERYLARMNATEESTKNSIIDYVTGTSVVDVGSGGGVLLELLEKTYPDKRVIGTDISENVIEALSKKKAEEHHGWNVIRHNFYEEVFNEPVDNVIFSSILHEIYSYTETENGRFDIESVKKALKNAYASLRPGGRIIIRDGIKTEVDESTITLRFKDPDGPEFFKNYVNDFKGLKDIEDKKIVMNPDGTVSACTNFIREFLFTYTWGKQSYAHEVQEQFGYFTLDEFRKFFEGIGAKLIRCEEFLEPGYPLHLSPKVELIPDKYPASNCIIVAEKA